MKGILIIKKEEHRPMVKIPVCECIAEDAKDGDEVEVTVKGTMIERDGKRFIAVESVDGEDLEEMKMEDEQPDVNMDADDALMHFMKNLKG